MVYKTFCMPGIFADGCSIYQRVELFAERDFADLPWELASTNTMSANYSEFLKQADATCKYSEQTECTRYIEIYGKTMGASEVKVPQWPQACSASGPSGLV
jgi:hypothetical protein